MSQKELGRSIESSVGLDTENDSAFANTEVCGIALGQDLFRVDGKTIKFLNDLFKLQDPSNHLVIKEPDILCPVPESRLLVDLGRDEPLTVVAGKKRSGSTGPLYNYMLWAARMTDHGIENRVNNLLNDGFDVLLGGKKELLDKVRYFRDDLRVSFMEPRFEEEGERVAIGVLRTTQILGWGFIRDSLGRRFRSGIYYTYG